VRFHADSKYDSYFT
ncbi:unnamed protein product, partial [Adineta steineri]